MQVTAGEEPEEMWNRGGGLAHLRQQLTIEWREEVNVTIT